MMITSSEKGTFKIFCLHGKLILTETGSIKDFLKGIEESGCETIILDLREVNSIDSYGLGCLIDVQQMLKKVNKKLVLAGPRESIKTLFENSCLVEIFDIVDTVEIP